MKGENKMEILEILGVMTIIFFAIITIPLVIGLLYVEINGMIKSCYKFGKSIRNKFTKKKSK
jgi:hypothetical protein